MTLEVTGVETIELSDPDGVCQRPATSQRPAIKNPPIPQRSTQTWPRNWRREDPAKNHHIWAENNRVIAMPSFNPEDNIQWRVGLPISTGNYQPIISGEQ